MFGKLNKLYQRTLNFGVYIRLEYIHLILAGPRALWLFRNYGRRYIGTGIKLISVVLKSHIAGIDEFI